MGVGRFYERKYRHHRRQQSALSGILCIPHLTDAQGHPTNAVYGFLNMLLKLYGELDPQYVAVAFDKSKHTFRNDLFDGYKATRKPAPDDLRPQFA